MKIYAFFGNQSFFGSNLLEKEGYSVHSINEVLELFAKNLKERGEDLTLEKVRERGYVVNNNIWLNMLLNKISKENDKIVVTDLWINDVIGLEKTVTSIFLDIDIDIDFLTIDDGEQYVDISENEDIHIKMPYINVGYDSEDFILQKILNT